MRAVDSVDSVESVGCSVGGSITCPILSDASKELPPLRGRSVGLELALQGLGLAAYLSEGLGHLMLVLCLALPTLDAVGKVISNDLVLGLLDDVVRALKALGVHDIDQLRLDQAADDGVELSRALNLVVGFLDLVVVPIDAVELELGEFDIHVMLRGSLCAVDLDLVGRQEIRDPGLSRDHEILHDILRDGTKRTLHHLEDLSGADQVVGKGGVRFVDCIAAIGLVEEEVVLNEDGEAVSELARVHRGILGELGEVGPAPVEEHGEDSLRKQSVTTLAPEWGN